MKIIITLFAIVLIGQWIARRHARKLRRARLSECFARDYTAWKETGCDISEGYCQQWHQAISRLESRHPASLSRPGGIM